MGKIRTTNKRAKRRLWNDRWAWPPSRFLRYIEKYNREPHGFQWHRETSHLRSNSSRINHND